MQTCKTTTFAVVKMILFSFMSTNTMCLHCLYVSGMYVGIQIASSGVRNGRGWDNSTTAIRKALLAGSRACTAAHSNAQIKVALKVSLWTH